MNTLIVGGTSGLGLEIARNEAAVGNDAIVTGRHDPEVRFAEYREFDLSASDLPARIGQFVMDLPPIKSLVYAAGYYQEGHITDLTDEAVDAMIDVGERGLVFFVKKILEKQNQLDELVTITSSSQWTAREKEPVYNLVKGGAGHYSHGQSLDPRIGKTLVAAPSGMDTEFWNGIEKDTTKMMRPEWVAAQVMELRQRQTGYTFAKILGATDQLPQRVEIVESQEAADRGKIYPGETVGQILYAWRTSSGLGKTEAARLLGRSRCYYDMLETDYRGHEKGYVRKPKQVRAKTLIGLADTLGINRQLLLQAGGYPVA